ncbi:MAG: hypothetical protein M0R28_18095 [Pigmentiphaga sp.]|nr:hypothetical protein [Pigmentiphaga sp.]
MTILLDHPWLDPLIQEGLLMRIIHDPLTSLTLFRLSAIPEPWAAQAGEDATFTKAGLKEPIVTPGEPGVDPEPDFNTYEQWRVVAQSYSGTTDVDMTAAFAGIVPLNMQQLKEEVVRAGRSIGRVSRNAMFRAYLGGHSIAEVVSVSGGDTHIQVNSLAGWRERIKPSGQLTLVGSTSDTSKIYTVNGLPPSVTTSRVIAAIPDDDKYPDGPGTLVVSGTPNIVANDRIEAFDRPHVIRSGGAKSVDAITKANVLTLDDIQRATAWLRSNSNSPHAEGECFHGHIDPMAEQSVFRDNAFQRLHEGRFEDEAIRNMALGYTAGTAFFTNNECPNYGTVGKKVAGKGSRSLAISAPEIGGDIRNRHGVNIVRTLITASGVMYEKYIDQSAFVSEAGIGGKMGSARVTSNGVEINTDRIAFILRQPQDRRQRRFSFTWAWDGDFGIPSDQLGGMNNGDGTGLMDWTPRYKRAVIIESASPM